MAITDPIANYLTKIRNASAAQHRFVDVTWSQLKEMMTEILKKNGYIENFIVRQGKQGGTIRIFLRFTDKRDGVINGLTRISKPGLRRYVGYKQIPMVFGGMGISILSTSKGVMEGNDARQAKVGGELLCMVW